MGWTDEYEDWLAGLGKREVLDWTARSRLLSLLLLRLGEWACVVNVDPAALLGRLVEDYLCQIEPLSRSAFEQHRADDKDVQCPCPDCFGHDFDTESLTWAPLP